MSLPAHWYPVPTELDRAHAAAIKEDRSRATKAKHRRMRIIRGVGVPGTCDVCGDASPALHWDHDHKTGAYRGHLCHYCNAALGFAKDDPTRLQALIAYLHEHQ